MGWGEDVGDVGVGLRWKGDGSRWGVNGDVLERSVVWELVGKSKRDEVVDVFFMIS